MCLISQDSFTLYILVNNAIQPIIISNILPRVMVGELAGYQLPTRVSNSWDSWIKECIEVS
jgi:hypothetical protein